MECEIIVMKKGSLVVGATEPHNKKWEAEGFTEQSRYKAEVKTLGDMAQHLQLVDKKVYGGGDEH